MLKVPKAGLTGGRAANVQIAPDQSAGVVAAFGDKIAGIGRAIEGERLDRAATRAQIDMTRDLGELRQNVEQLNDPDEIEQQWVSQSAVIRQRLLEGTDDNGRPLLDPKIRDRVGLAFDDLKVKHGLALGRAAVQARRTQRAANWLDYSSEVVRQSATVDADTRTELVRQGLEQITKEVADGTIDALTGVKRRIALQDDSERAAAIEMVANDPAGFLLARDQGGFNGLEPSVSARFAVQAQGNIDRQLAGEARAATAAAKESTRVVGVRLGDIAKISGDSRQPVDVAFLETQAAKDHPDYAKTVAAVDLMNERADLPFLTPAQLAEVIVEEKRRDLSKPFQAERLQVLEAQLAESEKAWATDPIDYASEIGMTVPEMPDIAGADPQELAMALARRAAFGRDLKDEGYIKSPVYLSVAEQDALKSEIGVSSDPARRAEMAATLTRTIGAQDTGAVMAISGDPVFAHVGGLLNDGGSFGVAQEIFRGQQVMAEKGIVMPPLPKRISPIFSQLGAVFADLTGGVTAQSNITKAADALYASRQSGIDPAGDLDADLYAQALHEVMGGTGTYGERDARGGVQEINGQLVALPAGVSGRDVDVTMQAIETLFRGGPVPSADEVLQGWTPDAKQQSLAVNILGEVSSTGKPPFVDGAPITIATFQNTRLQAIGADKYRLIYRANDQTYFVTDETGAQFTFSLNKLVQRVSQ